MAVNLANAFDGVGLDHKLIVSRRDGGLNKQVKSQDRLVFLCKKSTLDFAAFQKLRKVVAVFRPDVIHAHGTSIYWAVALKFLNADFKLIWHDHLGISEEVLKTNPRKELALMSSKIDFIITADEKTREHWINKKLKDAELIRYLGNFPQLSIINNPENELFTFVHLANYRSEKGHMTLIEAVKILSGQKVSFKVRMVGAAIDSSWKEKVKAKVMKEGLEKFISVEDATDNVDALLSEVNAGLVTSDREGLPVALLEYGLAGLPVISTKVGQCPKVLLNGEFGYLIDPGSPTQLAEEMRNMILNSEMVKSKAKEFQVHVEKHYGFEQFFKEYKQILKQLNIPVDSVPAHD